MKSNSEVSLNAPVVVVVVIVVIVVVIDDVIINLFVVARICTNGDI